MSKAPKTALASHIYDHTIENMIYMQEQGRKEARLSKAMTRPAYAYTRAEQKKIFQTPLCEPCGYYRENEHNKFECQFPWFEPQDYDLAAYDYLPCKEVDYIEEN